MVEHPRFRVHAYICSARVVQPTLEGWALFGDIYVHAPDGCRYVVAEATTGQFVVLECDPILGAALALKNDPPAPPRWSGPDPDPLVMKALALYDRA